MYYHRSGEVPAKRHSQFRGPSGELYHEELQGEEGFSGSQSWLYHRRIPTAISAARALPDRDTATVRNAPLLPRHLRTQDLPGRGDPVSDRVVLAGNAQVTLAFAAATESSPLYRNAVGDELVFVAAGLAVLESSFGSLAVHPGDYVVIPCSTTHRWVVTDGPLRLLIVEATGHVKIPGRYLSPTGQLLDGAPYTERDVRLPEGLLDGGDGPADVVVTAREGRTLYTYDNHPFDVVGWDGCNYPWAMDIREFQPRTGALHLPPPTYQQFEGPGFVVCSFVPRLFDYGHNAVKVPYNHANVDSDEVLFYWDGDFMSRAGSGIDEGSISLHPAGFIHGPQPGSAEKSLGAQRTEEYAVMVDTFQPLRLGTAAAEIEDDQYAWSWSRLDAAASNRAARAAT
jgi:homogentisate 1,2-dioxygenase